MKVGTKSLLFGVHQFAWHPWTVYRAWVHLYGRPTWRELLCIIIHDWGYWGAPNMDGEEGTAHPEFGARLAAKLAGAEAGREVLVHSRHYAKLSAQAPSRLCWADKLSILYDPAWFYMLRARLTREIREYRAMAAKGGFIPLTATDWEWFYWVREKLVELARTMDPGAVPYMPNGTEKAQKGA